MNELVISLNQISDITKYIKICSGATDQLQSDILVNSQQAILNGTRCFETDDVDDSGILLERRQCLRDLQILHIDQDNAQHIGDHAQ